MGTQMGRMGIRGFMTPILPMTPMIPASQVIEGFTQEAAGTARIIADLFTDLRFNNANDGSDERSGAVVFAAVPPRVAHVFDLGFVLFEPVEVFQEQQPGTLFGVVEFRCAAGFLPEDVVDVLEGLFERGRRLGFFAFLLVWSVDGPPGGLNQGALPVTCCV